jgi:pimeloyl-ACP methyl ester carboxylesterase
MAYLDRGGVKLYYEVHGAGPALLLTHGFASSARMWAGQVEMLARDFRLILWDMRGHGRSDYPAAADAYSEAATLDDMAALLDVAHAPTAVIGGLSLGGYLSLAFHRLQPDRVRALLIIDTGPGYRSAEARATWNQHALQTATRFETHGLEALEPAAAAHRESGVPQHEHRDASGLARAARGVFRQRDANVIDSLPGIDVPSLIVVGADDAPFLAPANYMAAKIPGARLVTIPNAGHFANLDNPAAFNAALRDFLQEAGLTHSKGI